MRSFKFLVILPKVIFNDFWWTNTEFARVILVWKLGHYNVKKKKSLNQCNEIGLGRKQRH